MAIAYDSTTSAAELAGAHRFSDKGVIVLLVAGFVLGAIIGAIVEASLRS